MRIISVYNFFSKCDVYENLTGYKAPFQVPAFLFLPPYPVLSTSSLPWATPTVSPPSLLQDRRKRSPGTEGHHVTGRRIGPQEKKLPPPLLDPPPRDNSEGTIAHGLTLLHFPCSSSLCAQGREKGAPAIQQFPAIDGCSLLSAESTGAFSCFRRPTWWTTRQGRCEGQGKGPFILYLPLWVDTEAPCSLVRRGRRSASQGFPPPSPFLKAPLRPFLFPRPPRVTRPYLLS